MKILGLVAGVIGALFILSLGVPMVSASTAHFSPEEVWTYKPKMDTTYDISMGTQKDTLKTSIHYDVNGDDVPDVLVEIHNYTAKTYTLVLLSGADGSVLYQNKFTDIASVHNGNRISIEASFYSITYTDSLGNVVNSYQYMIFQNYTDEHRISIYKLNGDLSNASYGYIEIPSTIHTSYVNVPINQYTAQINVMNYNKSSNLGLLFMGYYVGTVSGYTVVESQAIMLDYNLNVIWEMKNIGASTSSLYYPLGIGPTHLNGWGFNGGNSPYPGADILMVNESSGNTVISAIEASDGSELWNITLPGMVVLGSPVGNLGESINFIDYNNDTNVDLGVVVYNYTAKMTYVYFIDSSGNIVARYANAGMRNILWSSPTFSSINEKYLTIKTQDLNKDGYRDCAFIDNQTSLVTFDIKNNKTLYENSLEKGYSYMVVLSNNDINGDGTNDAYLYGENITTGHYWYEGTLTALNGATGEVLWNSTYKHLLNFALGSTYPKDFADIDNDGFNDEVIIQGYGVDSQGTYANITIISLKDGKTISNFTVHSDLKNEDYNNWTTLAFMPGDVNADGINDVQIMMYHYTWNNSVPFTDNFIRFYSGIDGTLLWCGEVYQDHYLTQVTRIIWKIGAPTSNYRASTGNNRILITTGDSVAVYEITGAIPEFDMAYMAVSLILIVAAIIYIRKK